MQTLKRQFTMEWPDPKQGETKHIWDPDNEDEAAAAKTLFDTMKKKGFTAFHAKGKEGLQGELMREWDPEAGRVILTRMVGG